MNIQFTETVLYDDIQEFAYSRFDFICPACSEKTCFFKEHENLTDDIHTSHFYTTDLQNNCPVRITLEHNKWNITDVDEYKNKLNEFFQSNEYKTILKERLLKEL